MGGGRPITFFEFPNTSGWAGAGGGSGGCRAECVGLLQGKVIKIY